MKSVKTRFYDIFMKILHHIMAVPMNCYEIASFFYHIFFFYLTLSNDKPFLHHIKNFMI